MGCRGYWQMVLGGRYVLLAERVGWCAVLLSVPLVVGCGELDGGDVSGLGGVGRVEFTGGGAGPPDCGTGATGSGH